MFSEIDFPRLVPILQVGQLTPSGDIPKYDVYSLSIWSYRRILGQKLLLLL